MKEINKSSRAKCAPPAEAKKFLLTMHELSFCIHWDTCPQLSLWYSQEDMSQFSFFSPNLINDIYLRRHDVKCPILLYEWLKKRRRLDADPNQQGADRLSLGRSNYTDCQL